MSEQKKIIMNFSVPPSNEDIQVLAEDVLDIMPDELMAYIEDMEIVVEDLPPQEMEDELGLDSPFELLAFYQKHAEKIPGVQVKDGPDTPVLHLYRRSILDMWCETEDDLEAVVRHVMVSEIAQVHDFNEDEIEKMAANMDSL